MSRAIQMGRMPVFLYDDYPWIPYLGTDADVEHFGFRGGLWDQNHSLPLLVELLKNQTDEQYQQKMTYLRKIRRLFTYEGFFEQFELFLKDPFGSTGGHLVCTVHPKSERCCG